MAEIRAVRGTTEILLVDRELRVSIDRQPVGSFTLPALQMQRIWERVTGISVPVTLGTGVGVGGIGSRIEIRSGKTRLALEWWMTPPPEWRQASAIFDLLAEHLPAEVRTRFDFARGGE